MSFEISQFLDLALLQKPSIRSWIPAVFDAWAPTVLETMHGSVIVDGKLEHAKPALGVAGKTKKCEDCHLKAASFALPAGKRRWCSGCAKGHVGAAGSKTYHTSKKCEGCQLKQPVFGLPAEGKKRWCSGCAKGHAGAVNIVAKKCEDCQLKAPSFGLPAEGKRLWCAGCAKGHVGAVNLKRKAEISRVGGRK